MDERSRPRVRDLHHFITRFHGSFKYGSTLFAIQRGEITLAEGDDRARRMGPALLRAHRGDPGSALSDQAHFIERIRMVSANELENRMTIEGPVAFVRPWQITIRYHRIMSLDRFIEFNCTENDRNPIVNGRLTIAPP